MTCACRLAMTGLLAAAIAIAAPAAATPHNPACPIPAEVELPSVPMPRASHAIAQRKRLVIMALGGMPMMGGLAGDPALGYPARMGAHLAAMLPDIEVVVRNRAIPDRSARNAGRRLPEELAQERPDLVLWASGSRDAVRRVDPAVYARVLEDGIDAIRKAGADTILMDVQFAPGWAAIPHLEDYREVIHTVGDMAGVVVFPRYRLMQHWFEEGQLDLAAEDRTLQMAVTRRLFDCLGEGLALVVRHGVGR